MSLTQPGQRHLKLANIIGSGLNIHRKLDHIENFQRGELMVILPKPLVALVQDYIRILKSQKRLNDYGSGVFVRRTRAKLYRTIEQKMTFRQHLLAVVLPQQAVVVLIHAYLRIDCYNCSDLNYYNLFRFPTDICEHCFGWTCSNCWVDNVPYLPPTHCNECFKILRED